MINMRLLSIGAIGKGFTEKLRLILTPSESSKWIIYAKNSND